MLVTLISEEKICSIRLPEKILGKYWLCDDTKSIFTNKILAIEADSLGNNWVLNSERKQKIYDEHNNEIRNLIISERKLYQIKVGDTDKVSFLLVEPFSPDRGVYYKYVVNSNISLHIGRGNDNDIIISNSYTSSHHATLSCNNGIWTICDNNSTNGTYVNRNRIFGSQNLKYGDTVFIFGYKLIVGSNFIAMNNPDNSVSINTQVLKKYVNNGMTDDEVLELDSEEYYYRSPRFVEGVVPLSIQVDAPTKREDKESTPILYTLGPSMVMGIASLSVGIFAIINSTKQGGSILSSIPTIITALSMLLGMILFPILMKKHERKHTQEKENLRREKYIKYLNNIKQEIQTHIKMQEELLNRNNQPIFRTVESSDFFEKALWGKSIGKNDFLGLRLGAGNMPMYADIKFPEDRFSIDDDVLRECLFEFQKEERLLMDVPIGVSLLEHRALGIVGDRGGIRNLLNNILLQIMLLHSYDEVKIVCLIDKADERHMSYVRYAQHIWDDEGKKRFLAITEDNLKELSFEINKVIAERSENSEGEREKENIPHYVILSASKTLANSCSFITDILSNAALQGFSVICAYDAVKSLPKECDAIVTVNGNQGLLHDTVQGCKYNFVQDVVTEIYAHNLIMKMADKTLDLNQGKFELPGMLTFMDMFGVGKFEHLNIPERWKNSNPVKTLQTPVGVGTNGEIMQLDLHEKFHGPHGLVAGMTGSGKSEFIITYILSLAVNYHPNEVAFVLIDYKGGGLTGAFENEHYRLPHLAGTITNLDSGSIMRSILSIKSELKRRQAIFNKARNIINEGTMDIYKYQKMYRDGIVEEPLPHLFIISDEFAELKSQQPEFMDQLISTARIGRSLGVHLILATQKPSGVVNEQIWANSKFKVCLKVQDKADSNDMLKRPDAAELSETGRFYLQVGYNELFELGQSAWAGAPYADSDTSGNEADLSIEIIDELGNAVDKIKAKKSVITQDSGKQIVRIMEHLHKLAEEGNISERPLWLPPLQAGVLLESLIKKYDYVSKKSSGLWALIGELDDPYTQSQRILDINMLESGNVIIYGTAGAGKEKMLSTMLYSLLAEYTAEELNVYILDFGSETLRAFGPMPQVGSVIIDGEDDKIHNFISLMNAEVKQRKKLLTEYGGDIIKYNRVNKDKLPYIFIAVNNYSNFYENYERYEEALITLTRECPKYGIFFALTATNTMAVRYRMLQNFRKMFVMQMNDKSDYVSILGNTEGVYPSTVKGSGIVKEEETYMFQTADIVGDGEDLFAYIKNLAVQMSNNSENMRAREIKTVPQFVSAAKVAKEVKSLQEIPLGISYESYSVINRNLYEKNILWVIAENAKAAENYGIGLAELLTTGMDMDAYMINVSDAMCEEIRAEKIMNDCEEKIVQLFNMAVQRNNTYKDTGGQPDIDMQPVLVLINNYAGVMEKLSDDGKDKLITMLTKVEGFCNMFFIICDCKENANLYYMDDWASNRCHGEGVWVGNGIDIQMRLQVDNKTSDLSGDINDLTGYYVADGEASRMRLIMPSKMEGLKRDE